MKTKPLIAGLLLCAIVMLVAHLEYRFMPVERAVREEQIRFVMPLPCSAVVAQRSAGEQWVTRCYVAPSAR